MGTNGFELETADRDSDRLSAQTDEEALSEESGQLDDLSYQRVVARNTFMNRFECDPQPGPYDFSRDQQDVCESAALHGSSWRTQADDGVSLPNFYAGRQIPWRGAASVDNFPVVHNGNTGDTRAPLRIGESFVVKNGVTTRAVLDIPRDCSLRLLHGKDCKFTGADILLSSGDPLEAIQGGLVVYSSRMPNLGERINLNGLIVPVGDLGGYEGSIVVVQSWDDKVKGVRYHIYSGLDNASVVAGDRIRAGQQIGRADANGVHYEVHSQSVQGPAIRIEARRRRSN